MEANTDKQKTPDTGGTVSAPAPQKSSPKEEGLDFSNQQIAVPSAKDRKTREHALALAVVIVLFIVIGLAVAGFLCIKPEPDRIQGQCDATEVRISGKLPGRAVFPAFSQPMGCAMVVMIPSARCLASAREYCTATGCVDSTTAAYGVSIGTPEPSAVLASSMRMWTFRRAGQRCGASCMGSRSSK